MDDPRLETKGINFILGVKQKNDGKVNSHKWFFQGVCNYLKPDFTLQLDVGTKTDDYAIVKLFKHMSNNPDCGGCCGEIEVDIRAESYNQSFVVQAA